MTKPQSTCDGRAGYRRLLRHVSPLGWSHHLHRLALPHVLDPGTDATERRLGLFVPCETTGADWARDVVVELALLPFTTPSAR